MRSGAVLIVLAVTALLAYSLGLQGASDRRQPPPATPASPTFMKPMAFVAAAVEPSAPTAARPAPSSATAALPTIQPRPAPSDAKRKVEIGLAAAAIAALIIQASRDQYHATGHPCACPDDTMRNGRSCGRVSAYSRPGGASPLCYPTDVSAAMIDAYRQRQVSR
jgi:hypothetical protein